MPGSVAAPVRIGLIGINARAHRLLLPGLAASPNARLTAIISRNSDKASATAAGLGPDVLSFTRLEDALHAGVMDAVYVNTPATTHFPLCTAALEARMAVICEKPLSATREEAVTLAEHAARAGVRTAVNFTYRSVPGYRLTERWLASRARCPLGRPLHAHFELLQGHNFFPDFQQGSALLDSGSHLFDFMAGLLSAAQFGQIREVFASPLRPDVSDDGPDYGWSFTARTTSGVAISALFTRSALGWRNGFRWTLSGDQAAIDVELDADRTLARTVTRADSAPQGTWRPLEVPPDIAADDARFPAYHLDRLVRAIRGEESFPTFSDAVRAHHVADALRHSAEARAWAAVPSST